MNKLNLQEISAPVRDAMEEFNGRFKQSLKTDSALLDKIIRYILKRKGKQMRPLFVFLTSLLNGGIRESSYHAAALIELLHTASLVHDDVVDESDMRRGMFSVNALWKNKAAVLVGDYLLSRGLLLSLETGEFEMLRIVSAAVKEMSEGELLQIEKARFGNITEETYLKIVEKKTASLIAACCACGARAAGAGEENVAAMHRFGKLAGIAFQIKDDLFDFQSTTDTGKPAGLDLHDRKLSLPLIYLIKNATPAERRYLLSTVKRHNDDPEHVIRLLELVRDSKGLDYARERMLHYRDEAIAILNGFAPGEARTSLEQLLIFTTERNH